MNDFNCGREYSFAFRERTDDSQIGRIVRGSIDMHLHFDREVGVSRRQDALETALAAREMGLRGIVLKNHNSPTALLANLVSRLVPDIAVIGSICLEYEVGGLNAHAVETTAKLGAKVVWLPCLCSTNSRALVARRVGIDVGGDGISVLGANGKLVPEAVDVLKVIKDYDMVLATGHISPREIFAVVDKAKQLGVAKIVVTHAMFDFISEHILAPDDRQMLAKEGVLIEHTALEIWPGLALESASSAEVAAAIKSEGPSNCIMSTDFGEIHTPTQAEGMRMFISSMLKFGLSEEDITHMVKLNPARLLGL